MKKKLGWVIAVCLLLCILVLGVFVVRSWNHSYGREQGYLSGYSVGYTDGCSGEEQNWQGIAQESVPFAFGSSKWKGFMRGFDVGYGDGYAAAND